MRYVITRRGVSPRMLLRLFSILFACLFRLYILPCCTCLLYSLPSVYIIVQLIVCSCTTCMLISSSLIQHHRVLYKGVNSRHRLDALKYAMFDMLCTLNMYIPLSINIPHCRILLIQVIKIIIMVVVIIMIITIMIIIIILVVIIVLIPIIAVATYSLNP